MSGELLLAPAKYTAAAYGGRITYYIVLSAMVAASGGAVLGIDYGISAGVSAMDSFLKKFFPDIFEEMKSDTQISNYCKFNSQVLTLFNSCIFIASLFASMVAGLVTEKFGRRASMLSGAAMFLAGSAVGAAAVNMQMLILSRILVGFGNGFSTQAILLYLSEMAHPLHRGAFSGSFDNCLSLGILVANIINYGTQKIKSGYGWRISVASAVAPAFLLLIGILFLPETPSSIIYRGGDPDHARRILQKIRGTHDVEDELGDITSATTNASKTVSTQRPFLLLTHQSYRPHLVFIISMPIFLQLTGIVAANLYTPLVFRIIGEGESGALMASVVTRAVNSISVLVTTLILADRVGRRVLFITGGVMMVIAHAALGAVLREGLPDHGTMSKGTAYAVVGITCLFMAAFGCSWGPLAWVVLSEIMPIEIRSLAQSIQLGINYLVGFALAQSLLSLLCGMKSGLYFFYAGAAVVMTMFVYWFMPETKGVPMEKMGQVWAEHWYWKKFVGANKIYLDKHDHYSA